MRAPHTLAAFCPAAWAPRWALLPVLSLLPLCTPQIALDIKSAKRELKKARTVLQMDELKCRKRVLRRLGFATSSDVIEMKGRVACEISR